MRLRSNSSRIMCHSVSLRKHPKSRLQGYSVAIHFGIPYITQAMGQENMATFAEKISVIYTDDTGFATVTADREILIPIRGTPTIVGTGFRANRSRLRQYLLNGLNLETGVESTGIELPVDGVVIAIINKGDNMADIIVGADGLHSSIRQSIIGDKVEELTIMNLSGSTDITTEQYKTFAKYSPTHAMIHGTKLPGKQGVANIFFSINDFSKDNITYHMRWVISWDIALIHKNIPETNAALYELAKEIAVQFCDPFKSIVQDTDPALRFG
ncbi:hypothetical protein BC943DRAFT_321319 [Umbelopsis sp. AD052]|nr:hypothetical protein BC943DRAFT_321319 [Umbelopsis sp. AD052]